MDISTVSLLLGTLTHFTGISIMVPLLQEVNIIRLSLSFTSKSALIMQIMDERSKVRRKRQREEFDNNIGKEWYNRSKYVLVNTPWILPIIPYTSRMTQIDTSRILQYFHPVLPKPLSEMHKERITTEQRTPHIQQETHCVCSKKEPFKYSIIILKALVIGSTSDPVLYWRRNV